MRKFILFGLLISFVFSCKESTPDGVIPQEKMTLVLWDYMEADVYSFEQLRDSLRDDSLVNAKLQTNIFKKYKVTKEEFKNSYDYYSKNTKLLKSIIDSILIRKQRVDTSETINRGTIPEQVL
jgi:hypothetical protein